MNCNATVLKFDTVNIAYFLSIKNIASFSYSLKDINKYLKYKVRSWDITAITKRNIEIQQLC